MTRRTKLALLLEAEGQKPKWKARESVPYALAEHLGRDVSSIYRWAAGSRTPRAANATRIAEFFGVEVGDVIGWADEVEVAA